MKGLASRKLAVEILLKVEQEGAFANPALSAAFKTHSLSERDRAFVTYIVQGTLRHQLELDDQLKKLSKKPIERLSPPLRSVLRSALYQILHMEDMPPSAVINTSVEIARKMGHEGSAKFVNGVLRSFQRSRAAEAKDGDLSAKTENKHSVPDWLYKRWLARFGEAESALLLEDTQKIPQLTLRTCDSAITTEGLMEILRKKGISVEQSMLMPHCIKIVDRGTLSGPISKLPGYSEGLFTVQDDASALVSIILAPEPGQTVLDMCAAPGSKSFHLGELMQNKGRVIALDSSEKRLSLLAKERRRLGLTNIETVVKDGRDYDPGALCDCVLIDAPCSGTGVMNRRSDLRQHREEAHIHSLVETQRALLENAAKVLKPGGTMVYSTCSMEMEENEDNIGWFLEKHPEFKLDNLLPFFSKELLERWSKDSHWEETRKQIEGGAIQLLPSRHSCSGFFISRFKRES